MQDLLRFGLGLGLGSRCENLHAPELVHLGRRKQSVGGHKELAELLLMFFVVVGWGVHSITQLLRV
jgi:hypothetical protein